jgi:hypothetical protein
MTKPEELPSIEDLTIVTPQPGVKVRAFEDFTMDAVQLLVNCPQYHPYETRLLVPTSRKKWAGLADFVWCRVPEMGGGKAAFAVNKEHAQQLMDDLWRCGLRPTEGHGSVGQLGAVKDHLRDMQALAFGKLKIERPD